MIQHNDTQHKHPVSVCWVSHFFIVRLSVIMPCRCAECCYADCRVAPLG